MNYIALEDERAAKLNRVKRPGIDAREVGSSFASECGAHESRYFPSTASVAADPNTGSAPAKRTHRKYVPVVGATSLPVQV